MASNRYVCEQNLVFIKDLAALQSGPLLFNTINSYIAEFQKNNGMLLSLKMVGAMNLHFIISCQKQFIVQ